LVLAGTAAVAILSAASLPWPLALTSIALGALMVAGADVDARAYLLPNTITFSTLACGILAALVLEPFDPWRAAAGALARAAGTAGVLAALRFGYARLKGEEGIGLGDVKLAAGVGAWLPLEHIALCFALAAGAALLYAFHARSRGRTIRRTSRIPFGAFLCPALWLAFYAGVVAA
jgi:leader peptidase (prepilin peptidase)/N-methyltransferase